MTQEWQETLVRLLQSGVSFSSYDSSFVTDLIHKFETKEELTDSQQRYLEYFVYRYRDQIKDQVIYSQPSEETREVLEDNVREQIERILSKCEESYEVINNDEN